jgi:hypothetical protein
MKAALGSSAPTAIVVLAAKGRKEALESKKPCPLFRRRSQVQGCFSFVNFYVPVYGIFEIPNSKHQIPKKSQIRNTNDLK